MPSRTAGPSVTDERRHIKVLPERVTDVSSTDFPGHYPGQEEEHSWDLARFKKVNPSHTDADVCEWNSSFSRLTLRIFVFRS
jgi:hypothetical protein